MRDAFRQALLRARSTSGDIQCAGEHYILMDRLGTGDISEVYLARRAGAMPYLATIKLSSAPTASARYEREAEVLHELHAISSLLPEVVARGPVNGTPPRQALVFAHPTGYWGSLADLNARFPQGIDPRHAVWIWRRMLAVLRFIQAQGWSHGDVRPEHALVHPEDHTVRLISWGSAQKDNRNRAEDLMRSARTTVVLLSGANASSSMPGTVPAGLADLVTRAGHDPAFCEAQGAQGLDDRLRAAALEAFGPPSFVPLNI